MLFLKFTAVCTLIGINNERTKLCFNIRNAGQLETPLRQYRLDGGPGAVVWTWNPITFCNIGADMLSIRPVSSSKSLCNNISIKLQEMNYRRISYLRKRVSSG